MGRLLVLTIEPTGAVLGATVHCIDATRVDEREFAQILLSLGRHGVLRFPDQRLDLGDLRAFSQRFGDIQGPSAAPDTENEAHVGTLSNLKQGGKYVGVPDAGQTGTDMSYRDVMGFVNVRSASASRAATAPARRHRVLQHARRLRCAAGRYQDTSADAHDARLRSSGSTYAATRRAPAADRGTAPPSPAGSASVLTIRSPAGRCLQSRPAVDQRTLNRATTC
jgi:alpha-ketoglutarate-dependent taurine dioxygenase